MQKLTHNNLTNREKIINHVKNKKKWVYDMHEKDITQYQVFIQNKSFKGVRVHN